jgi:uncharacterized protein (TIGR00369 family)
MTDAELPPSLPLDVISKHAPAGEGAMNDHMGLELTYITPQRVAGRIPVALNTQPYGLLHGGASIALAETLASVGSAMHAQTLGAIAVGLEVNATHHRAATSGYANGVATAIHLGRTTATYEIVITNDEGKRLCTSRITCAVVPAERFA